MDKVFLLRHSGISLVGLVLLHFESMEDATQHGEPGCNNKLECMKEQHPDGIQEPFVEIVGDIGISEELPQQTSGLEEILRNVQNPQDPD